jgi:hypothetical protein
MSDKLARFGVCVTAPMVVISALMPESRPLDARLQHARSSTSRAPLHLVRLCLYFSTSLQWRICFDA